MAIINGRRSYLTLKMHLLKQNIKAENISFCSLITKNYIELISKKRRSPKASPIIFVAEFQRAPPSTATVRVKIIAALHHDNSPSYLFWNTCRTKEETISCKLLIQKHQAQHLYPSQLHKRDNFSLTVKTLLIGNT